MSLDLDPVHIQSPESSGLVRERVQGWSQKRLKKASLLMQSEVKVKQKYFSRWKCW
jgi:hypothetical protein